MPWTRLRLSGPLGIGGEIEREAQTVGPGCVKCFEREINGEKVLVMIVNRETGFKILILNSRGTTATVYKDNENG